MGKSAPPPPDYQGAADTQTWANRSNVQTPWGTMAWSPQSVMDPTTGKMQTQWTGSVQLSPEEQQALNSQFQLQQQRSGLGEQLFGRAADELGQPIDWNSLASWQNAPQADEAARHAATDAAYQQATSRLDPQWQQQEDATRSRLYSMGLKEGDPAFDQQMGNFQRAKTDAYNQANYSSIGAGLQAEQQQVGLGLQSAGFQNNLRQQQLAQQLQAQGFTLNEINGILNGQQVGMPQFPGQGGAGDYLGAMNNMYQGQLAGAQAQNQMWSNIGSGAAMIGAAAMMASDERGKEKIGLGDDELEEFIRAGDGSAKYHYYEPSSFGAAPGEHVTPMAQDIERTEIGRHMVHDTPSGKIVDYGRAMGTMHAALAHLNRKIEGREHFLL